MNEIVFAALNAIEEALGQIQPEQYGFRLDPAMAAALSDDAARSEALSQMKQNELANGIVQLESLLNAIVDKDFDKFEIYTLRNILAVGHDEEDLANWVQLDHYKNVELGHAENTPSPEELQLQRRKLQETMKLNAMLKAEEARNAAMLSQLHTMLGSGDEPELSSDSPFAFLASSPHASKNAQSQPLTQNVQYAVTQLPLLRELLAQLKSSLQSMPKSRDRLEDPESVEAKRRQYIDTQSRRALQRRGVDPDGTAGREGTLGRRIGREEVEGMEAVAQALGGAQVRRRDN